MKKLLLLSILFILSCSTEPEDCNGSQAGTPVFDECNVCGGDNTVCTDCTGVINGDAIEDCLGVCNGSTELDENGCCGESVILWGECYNIEHTTELILADNRLDGEIPPEIGTLTNLENLDLNSNQLSGEIPPEIGTLTNLENLGLYSNQLTGEIPPEIGNLTNLGYLDLSSNQLSGEIPPEIGNLTNLTNLFLEYNQLTGEIPEGICNLLNLNWSTDYNNWQYKSYIHNNNFCPPYPGCVENHIGEQDCPE